MSKLSRRSFVRFAGTSAAAMAASPAIGQTPTPNVKRVLRLAHLTDIHVQPERAGGEGFAQCLQQVQRDAGYGLVDLFEDGTSSASYRNYGWKARE